MIASDANFLRCAAPQARASQTCRLGQTNGRLKVAEVVGFLLCVGHVVAGEVRLAWDPGPGKAPSGFCLYAGTNSLAQSQAAALVRIDAGTNTECTVSNLVSGRWYFVATAYLVQEDGTNRIESLPSNELVLDVPPAPRDMRTVILQWSAEVAGTNWLDVGFFRIRMEGGKR